jgi:hypothetical protein
MRSRGIETTASQSVNGTADQSAIDILLVSFPSLSPYRRTRPARYLCWCRCQVVLFLPVVLASQP